jgi:hypothetical protein
MAFRRFLECFHSRQKKIVTNSIDGIYVLREHLAEAQAVLGSRCFPAFPTSWKMNQCCQMVYFQTKNPNFGQILKGLEMGDVEIFMTILSILRPNKIFYGHLVHFVVIWYIFPVL